MISFLQGQIVQRFPTKIVLDVNGVGYEVNISLNAYQQLPKNPTNVRILTYLHVREDSMQLFGFFSAEERDLFLKLISVSGIGPRLAQGMLSGTTPDDFKQAVLSEDIGRLTLIPGVGKKTAQRIVLDLKEKLRSEEVEALREDRDEQTQISDEAVLALVSLGYRQPVAQKAVQHVLQVHPEIGSLEELIKLALSRVQSVH